jgi:hypothetical protein
MRRPWNLAGVIIATLLYFTAASGFAAPPAITDFSPKAAAAGTVITISGSNFAPKATKNIVHFGAVSAEVISSSPKKMKVRVPASATYAPITITVDGLTAYTQTPFEPIFVGGSELTPTNFTAPVDLPMPNGPHFSTIADLDGDGKPDLAIADIYDARISLYRNVSTPGPITTNSFEARVDLPALYNNPNNDNLWGITAADVDGDGKLDLLLCDRVSNVVWIYQNTSTVGTLDTNSFAAPVAFPTGTLPLYARVADLDGDGRPDIIVANSTSGTISILQNISSPGPITTNSFAPEFELPAGPGPMELAVGDLDGDGKPDIAVADHNGTTISIIQNLSSSGTLDTNSFAPAFTLDAPDQPTTLVLGDMDGDGKLDLILGCYDGSAVSAYQNLATPGTLSASSFAPRIDYSTGLMHALALGDMNGDSKLDIGVGAYSEISFFPHATNAGSFNHDPPFGLVDCVSGLNMWGLAIDDLDGDGRPDFIFCSGYSQMVSVVQNVSASPVALIIQLTALVDTNVPKAKALDADLSQATQAVNSGDTATAIKKLQAFQKLVHNQLARKNSDLATTLTTNAQQIIDSINAGQPSGT